MIVRNYKRQDNGNKRIKRNDSERSDLVPSPREGFGER